MVKRDLIYSNIIKKGLKWFKVIQTDQKISKIVQMIQNDPIWYKLV